MKSLKKELIETWVAQDAMEMLSDDLIEEIADIAVGQTEAEIAKNTKLPALTSKRAEVQKAIDNIADAIEKGVASDTLMNRLTDLEKQKKNLDRQIADEEKGIFRLDRDQVIYWLSQFKDGDIEDESFKRQLIDLMVNSVTVWELPDDDFEITTAYNLTSCKSKTFKASERFGFEKSCSTRWTLDEHLLFQRRLRRDGVALMSKRTAEVKVYKPWPPLFLSVYSVLPCAFCHSANSRWPCSLS